jgi:O-antigen biosynthesis protein
MAPRFARTVAAKLPGSRQAMRRVDQLRKAKPLAASGLFDVEWYQAQTGAEFTDADSCVRDYLAGGWRRGLSPNPLFEPAFFGRSGWSKSATDPVWEMLRHRTRRPTHPLFDPARYLRSVPDAEEHPGGALGHFLEFARDDSPLPVDMGLLDAEPLVWGDVRPRLIEAARRCAHDQFLGRKRMTRAWDSRAEGVLLARALALPFPSGGAPVVSIVMPVRDRATQVPDAIRSVQAQTFGEWELVVVDDGSTDDTRKVLGELAAEDARIVVLEREALGVSAARNEGIAQTRGRYVAFLDSDNQWTEHFLDVSLRLMDDRHLRAAYSALNGTRDGHMWYRAIDGGLEDLLVHNHIDLNSLVVERSLLIETGGFDTSLRRAVDWDLAIKIAKISPPTYLPFVGVNYDDDRQTADRITTRELASWGDRVLDAHIVDWPKLRTLPRVEGRVSIVMPTYDDWQMTVRAVCAVLDDAARSDGADVEVVVVDNGSSRVVWSTLQACFGRDQRVVLTRNARNLNFALGSNTGVAASTGGTILFLNNDTEVQPGWLGPLTAALAEPEVLAAQPLLLFPDGTVQCAGVVFPGLDGLPVHFLAHHPAEDALRTGTVDLSALTGAALAVRAADVLELKGFDPLYTNGWEDIDFCLRLAQLRAGRFVVPTASVVTHHESKTPGRGKHLAQNRRTFMSRWLGRLPGEDRQAWARAGFEVVHYLPDATTEVDVPRIPRPVVRRAAGPVVTEGAAPRLRWAIKVAAHPGPRGDGWGDVHFARSLARALTTLGQEVVVDRRDAHQRASMYLDDVVLNLRGLDDFAVQPGRVNLMWVISHPELVSADEVRRYHGVFAASESWSRRMGDEAGVAVQPLLQATDPGLFNPDRGVPGSGDPVLFVGSSRGIRRRVVDDAVRAGLDVSVYGPQWDGLLDARYVKDISYPNAELGAAYRSAGVVLNDHWDDMAREGFLSNRLFDAVASGARVISDDVDGLDELFGGAVQTYADAGELTALASPDSTSFPAADDLTAVARRVGREHSFDARAAVLLEHALALVAKR